jgi:hypothetical protein
VGVCDPSHAEARFGRGSFGGAFFQAREARGVMVE